MQSPSGLPREPYVRFMPVSSLNQQKRPLGTLGNKVKKAVQSLNFNRLSQNLALKEETKSSMVSMSEKKLVA